MNTFKISSLRAGLAVVTDRASTVELIDAPIEATSIEVPEREIEGS